MILQDLIKTFEKHNPDKIVRKGFFKPHSYRGDYTQLAFEPIENISIRNMLLAARSAMDKTFMGYKGGEYQMGKYTTVYVARYGEIGEEIGELLLYYMLGEPEEESLKFEV